MEIALPAAAEEQKDAKAQVADTPCKSLGDEFAWFKGACSSRFRPVAVMRSVCAGCVVRNHWEKIASPRKSPSLARDQTLNSYHGHGGGNATDKMTHISGD
jgi:hypothetical protein